MSSIVPWCWLCWSIRYQGPARHPNLVLPSRQSIHVYRSILSSGWTAPCIQRSIWRNSRLYISCVAIPLVKHGGATTPGGFAGKRRLCDPVGTAAGLSFPMTWKNLQALVMTQRFVLRLNRQIRTGCGADDTGNECLLQFGNVHTDFVADGVASVAVSKADSLRDIDSGTFRRFYSLKSWRAAFMISRFFGSKTSMSPKMLRPASSISPATVSILFWLRVGIATSLICL